ncbi:MAG: hypothetical protein E2O35_01230 [Proteobacteria bacterium]|nr:MAG: hypothetical protein E2O35_01230 [Pseudomonadota bacterium]
MLKEQFLRIFELIDLIDDRSDPGSYFREFESKITDPDRESVWTAREADFQKLDDRAWNFLKAEAKPYLRIRKVDGRAWSQLISALNEARGYIYLRSLGCTNVNFIPKAKCNGIETPDVRGNIGERIELCEVKTIHISEDTLRAQRNGDSTSTEVILSPGFLGKLDFAIEKAESQLLAYPLDGEAGRTVLIVINFDDRLAEYKVDYYAQIDDHLGAQSKDEAELAFFNSRTAFHNAVKMINAKVINE